MDRDDFKRQVLQSTDIVRLIGQHIALKPKGREMVALCPFHDDKRPSMHVVPSKQIYKCFACGAGGDAFSFVMNYLKMSFPEAIRHLAEQAGLAVPEHFSNAGQTAGAEQRKTLAEANEAAVRFFRARLTDDATGKLARDYLADRGIDDSMIEQFAIGYAPDDWDALARGIQQRKLNADSFVKVGLIARRNDGSLYDRFRHRLIFPIFDGIGRPIAFGGRILAGSNLDDPTADAKYVNSPESELFNKSATLFGLNLAKRPMIKQRTAVIVEGYTDVIACHQHGFDNVVATLGTALTAQHAAELRRYCEKVVLVFDADEAGQKAADRAMEVFFGEPIDVAIAVLPAGMDPADLLGAADGPRQWKQAIQTADDAMDFHFRRIRDSFNAVDTIAGRQRIAEDYLRTLVRLGLRQLEPTRRGMVLQHLADLLHLDLATVDQLIRQAAAAHRQAARHRPADEPMNDEPEDAPSLRHRLEKLIVGCVLADASLFHADMPDGRPLDETVPPGDLAHLPTRRLYELIYDWLAEHDRLDTADLRSISDDEQVLTLAMDLRMDVERKCGEDAGRVAEQLQAAVRRWRQICADEAYTVGPTDEAAAPPDQAQDEINRIARAFEHARAAPSAARVPKARA